MYSLTLKSAYVTAIKNVFSFLLRYSEAFNWDEKKH